MEIQGNAPPRRENFFFIKSYEKKGKNIRSSNSMTQIERKKKSPL